MGRMSTEIVEEKEVEGCCSGGVAWGEREAQSTSVKGRTKTTVGDKPMLWRQSGRFSMFSFCFEIGVE